MYNTIYIVLFIIIGLVSIVLFLFPKIIKSDFKEVTWGMKGLKLLPAVSIVVVIASLLIAYIQFNNVESEQAKHLLNIRTDISNRGDTSKGILNEQKSEMYLQYLQYNSDSIQMLRNVNAKEIKHLIKQRRELTNQLDELMRLRTITGQESQYIDSLKILKDEINYLKNEFSESQLYYDTLIKKIKDTDAVRHRLINIIKEKQERYIKKSFNTTNCFTERNYEDFNRQNKILEIKNDLRKDNKFIHIVIGTKDIAPEDWQNIKRLAEGTYKKTWEELGGISPDGQTDAGQKAEKKIARAIVDLIVELRRKDKSELERMYE